MKKIFIGAFVALFLAFLANYAQSPETEFQNYLSRINPVLNASTKDLNPSQINVLQDIINLSDNRFGAQYQKVVRSWKTRAQEKLADYENYQRQIQETEATRGKLNVETGMRQAAESARDSVIVVADSLRKYVVILQQRISKLEGERSALKRSNAKLTDETRKAADNLEMSRNSVRRMLDLLAPNQVSGDIAAKLPQSLQDSLQQTECNVAELLKNNYVLTLKSMERDKPFLDSAGKYYRQYRQHLPSISEYLETGDALAARLDASASECARDNAEAIRQEIKQFRTNIELMASNNSFWANILIFFNNLSSNPLLLILLIIIGLALLVLLIAAIFFGRVALIVSYNIFNVKSGETIDAVKGIRERNFELPVKKNLPTLLFAKYPFWRNAFRRMGGKSPIMEFRTKQGFIIVPNGFNVERNSSCFELGSASNKYEMDINDVMSGGSYRTELLVSRD
ncbi:MAG: hypothetical protein ACM3U1_09410 [Chloroflexota bacterium]